MRIDVMSVAGLACLPSCRSPVFLRWSADSSRDRESAVAAAAGARGVGQQFRGTAVRSRRADAVGTVCAAGGQRPSVPPCRRGVDVAECRYRRQGLDNRRRQQHSAVVPGGVGLYTGNGGKSRRFERNMVSDCTWGVVLASGDMVIDSAIVANGGSGLLQLPWVPPGPPLPQPSPQVGIVLYDGAGEYRDVSVFGFSGGGPTLFMAQGAARRRTSAPISGFRSFASISSATLVPPRLDQIQDCSIGPVGNLNSSHPDNPRVWGFSLDNPDATLGGSHPTIVSNHPMVLTGVEVALPSSAGRLRSSPHRFGLLRTFFPSNTQGVAGAVNPRDSGGLGCI